MGFLDKMRNRLDRGKGTAKQRIGRDRRDPYLETEGRAEKHKAGFRQVGERLKDAAKELRRTTR
ncbi:CsbD family protein [Actinocorallia lasiicapitis]